MDIRKLIDSSPMGLRQWSIIFVALYLNALDGYDMVAMAFGAGQVAEAFTLSDVQLGWLLSAALIGIGLGSLFLAPTADRMGRTRLITISLFIDLVGLVATAFAPTFALLFIFRVLTGIGVGGVLVCVTVLVSEYSNLRFRGLAVAIYASGYGLGASLCGVIASAVAPSHGWQAIFWVGAGLTVVAIALTVLFVPESADFPPLAAVWTRFAQSPPSWASRARSPSAPPRTKNRALPSRTFSPPPSYAQPSSCGWLSPS